MTYTVLLLSCKKPALFLIVLVAVLAVAVAARTRALSIFLINESENLKRHYKELSLVDRDPVTCKLKSSAKMESEANVLVTVQ